MSNRLTQLLAMLADSPSDSFILFAVAKEYEGLQDLDTAVEYYERLRGINADYVGLYYHLAHCYAELDKEEDAMKTYDLGIAIAQRLGDHHSLAELKNAKLNYEMGL